MGLFDGDSKHKKSDLITLQNIVLDIEEKKLMVSEEFLDQMVKIYISKFMKKINNNICDISKVASLTVFFKKYDFVMSNLEELIKIEPLYRFNKPVPTDYKKQIEDNLPVFMNSYITKNWRKVMPSTYESVKTDPKVDKRLKNFFETFIPFQNRLPEESKEYLEKLRESVYPPEETPENVSLEEKPSEEAVSEFVPETFERIEPDSSNAPGTGE